MVDHAVHINNVSFFGPQGFHGVGMGRFIQAHGGSPFRPAAAGVFQYSIKRGGLPEGGQVKSRSDFDRLHDHIG